jgi:hypothetical protein
MYSITEIVVLCAAAVFAFSGFLTAQYLCGLSRRSRSQALPLLAFANVLAFIVLHAALAFYLLGWNNTGLCIAALPGSLLPVVGRFFLWIHQSAEKLWCDLDRGCSRTFIEERREASCFFSIGASMVACAAAGVVLENVLSARLDLVWAVTALVALSAVVPVMLYSLGALVIAAYLCCMVSACKGLDALVTRVHGAAVVLKKAIASSRK